VPGEHPGTIVVNPPLAPVPATCLRGGVFSACLGAHRAAAANTSSIPRCH